MDTKRPLQILFLHQGAELYGSDRVLLNLSEFLTGKGHSVTVIIPEHGPLDAALEKAGVSVARIHIPVIRRKSFKGFGVVRFFLSLPSSYTAFRRLARELKPDIICTNTSTILTGALWSLFNRKPHVWLLHEIYRKRGFSFLLFSAVIRHLSKRVVSPSKAVAESLLPEQKKLGPKMIVIPNGIKTELYEGRRGTLRAQLDMHGDEILVGVVARFNWWKGQREMIPAMAKVISENRRIHFVFAGAPYRGDEGILRNFKKKVAAAGISENVHHLGEVADMGKIYADLDFSVLPSIQPEPFGLVLIESMVAGRPVIAFDQGGPPEIIDPSCGILVPPRNQDALARAILDLADDPKRRLAMGKAGADKVHRLFTFQGQGRNFEALLKDLVRENGSPRKRT